MKATRSPGRVYLEGADWVLELWEDWTEWFRGRSNWYSFTVVAAAYEDEAYLGNREVVLGLLGLNLRWSWVSDPGAEGRAEIEARMAELGDRLFDEEGKA